jgi:YrbI family 3-deoxy-D-manno-octulosonate 8-phosphate phosphatase
MSVLAVIPARGGSKGVPGKNLRELAGKPLVVHSIEDALGARGVERVVVSTDDAEIATVSRGAGAEVIERPAAISGDQATTESALLHALEVLGRGGYAPELVVLLQATSPLRDPEDVEAALDVMVRERADSLLSVCPSHDFHWTVSSQGGRAQNYDPLRRPRRQDMEPQLRENGSIYVSRARGLVETGSRLFGRVAVLPMNAVKGVQIDTPEDWAIVEALWELHRRQDALDVLREVKLLVFDFDGVWTNNQVLVLEDGREGVLCNRSDGLGLSLLRDSGMKMAVLTAELNPAPLRRCEKLKIPCVQVEKHKLPALERMIAEHGVEPRQVAFVGNDINDVPCMRHAGVGIAVADALPACRRAARLVTTRPGGLGAVREVVDWFLEARSAQ